MSSAMIGLRCAGVLALGLCGCASGPRFKDQPIVWRVDDTRSIAEPEEREFRSYSYYTRALALRRLTRTLELPDDDPALNTNALDEVPDSTWFQNRIGARDISPAEAARGPITLGPPQLPLTISRGKDMGGGNPGFVARDATGRTFLIKFDLKSNPEMETATSTIVNRIVWTLGYNVPEDSVFVFARSDLAIAPGGKTTNALGNEVPLTMRYVDQVLAQSPRTVEGRYRASASLLLKGKPRGGFSLEGVRDDDPNDRVDHQDRRELRGLRVFAAWLGHTDMKEDNTLDMYVEQDGRRYLRHYLLDFGEALGAHQAEKGRLEDGYEYVWDWERNGAAIFTLGLWKRPWEDQQQTPWPAIGAFGAKYFDPEGWREAYPFWPFLDADAADLYWGAKLVMRFSRAHLTAIVAEGQLSNPAAAAYLVDALLARRYKIGRAWLEALTPLDYLRIDAHALCGVDLGVHYRLAQEGALVRLDAKERPVEEVRVAKDGAVCMPIEAGDGYHIMNLRIRRGTRLKPVMSVHYKGGARPRILGVIREPL
jgi:hypothetical protein